MEKNRAVDTRVIEACLYMCILAVTFYIPAAQSLHMYYVSSLTLQLSILKVFRAYFTVLHPFAIFDVAYVQ
jgi:uncharacterized membrane protein